VNPGAETGDMSGWSVNSGGESMWAVGFDGLVHSGEFSFSTSYEWNTRFQTINLLDAGFTAEDLDAQPDIVFSDWLATRFDQGGQYYLKFSLLDGNGNLSEPLGTFSFGDMNSPLSLASGTDWFQVSHTFSSYGPGVRYLYFEEGGKDETSWGGNYGTHFDDASVVVAQAIPEPATHSLFLGSGLLLLCARLRKSGKR